MCLVVGATAIEDLYAVIGKIIASPLPRPPALLLPWTNASYDDGHLIGRYGNVSETNPQGVCLAHDNDHNIVELNAVLKVSLCLFVCFQKAVRYMQSRLTVGGCSQLNDNAQRTTQWALTSYTCTE